MSDYQANILLQFYDCLNTDFINGNLFIEHLTHKDFVAYATQLCVKNDLIPYYLLQNLAKIEKMRLSKIFEAFKEAISRLPSPPSDDQTLQNTAKQNMLMASSTLNMSAMFEDWLPSIPNPVKGQLIKTLAVGDRMLPSTSGWKSDGFGALIKKVIESVCISDYNQQVLFKEQYFEDKEWFVDLSDGKDIIDAILAQEAAERAALEEAKNTKGKKK